MMDSVFATKHLRGRWWLL